MKIKDYKNECVCAVLEEAPAPLFECVEDENHTPAPPTFSSVIQDVEVVEGSAARFDCKIEGKTSERLLYIW